MAEYSFGDESQEYERRRQLRVGGSIMILSSMALTGGLIINGVLKAEQDPPTDTENTSPVSEVGDNTEEHKEGINSEDVLEVALFIGGCAIIARGMRRGVQRLNRKTKPAPFIECIEPQTHEELIEKLKVDAKFRRIVQSNARTFR